MRYYIDNSDAGYPEYSTLAAAAAAALALGGEVMFLDVRGAVESECARREAHLVDCLSLAEVARGRRYCNCPH